MRIFTGVLVTLLVAACGGGASSAPTVGVVDNAKFGKILATPAGRTLYTWDKDASGASECYEACVGTWPPFTIATGDPVAPSGLKGKLATAARKDGAKQVTYNGKPLYFYSRDQNAGDAVGEGSNSFGAPWHVVKDP